MVFLGIGSYAVAWRARRHQESALFVCRKPLGINPFSNTLTPVQLSPSGRNYTYTSKQYATSQKNNSGLTSRYQTWPLPRPEERVRNKNSARKHSALVSMARGPHRTRAQCSRQRPSRRFWGRFLNGFVVVSGSIDSELQAIDNRCSASVRYGSDAQWRGKRSAAFLRDR